MFFLLQIHGNADDNVHHQHSLQLAKAYAEKGKHMEMFIYPNAHHGLGNNNFLTSYHLNAAGLSSAFNKGTNMSFSSPINDRDMTSHSNQAF